ncbi:uncharacterized protein LOC144089495 isoform X3 [Stigmatopora argus]
MVMLLDGSRRCRRTTLPDGKSSLICKSDCRRRRQHHNFGHVTFMSFMASSREEFADRPQEQLGQMHVATAFVMPDALDNVEEEQEEKNGVQPTDRQVKACLPHPVTAVGLSCVLVIRETPA